MSKDFSSFKYELPPSHDRYHAVIRGNLFIFFEKNKATILPGQDRVIQQKVVDFLVKAVRALGPDKYNLSVLGMASASGPHDFNRDMAGQRAYNSAMCAIRHFESRQRYDPTLKGTSINPVTQALGDDLAEIDARILHLKKNQIDQQQGIFRSAVFRLTAGRLQPHIDHPPSFVCNGPEAIRRAHELLANNEPEMTPFPTPWGLLFVKKGQVWGPTKRLIVSANWQNITYLEGDTLWSTSTGDFAREIMLDGLIEGMQRAKPMAEAAKVVMTFVQGLLVGPLEAIAAKLIVLFMWAGAHEDLVRRGMNAIDPAIRALKYIHDRCPTLWTKLMQKIQQQVSKELVDALEETVTKPENIAFFLGRVLRGVGGLDKLFFGKATPAKQLVAVSIGKILFITIECAALVTALHLPEGLAAVTRERIEQLAKDLQQDFASKNDIEILLNDPEARTIAEELLRPGVKAEIEKLQVPLRDFQNMLDKFVEDMADLD
jgi:hypothetical protein